MDAALAPYYERLRERMSEAQFEAKLAELADEFGGLLDEETLALLLLDEMGLNEGAYVTLHDLPGRSEATVRVTLESIEPVRTFARANGGEGRVCNCVVSDATGQARMVLWDKDVDKAEDGTLRPKARLTLVNARVKEGRYGMELHVGPWTVLDVEGALDPAKRKLLADVAMDGEARAPAAAKSAGAPVQTKLVTEELPTTLVGALAWRSDSRAVRRPEGGVAFACDFDLQTDEGLRRVVAWDDAVKSLRGVAPGARVRVEHLAPKVRGAATEWHTTRETTVQPA